MTLEVGGSSPNIILDGADRDVEQKGFAPGTATVTHFGFGDLFLPCLEGIHQLVHQP